MPKDDTIVIERLTRVETKIDFFIERSLKVDATLENHDNRLSQLESNYRLLATIGAIVIFIVTYFQDWISAHILG